MFTGSQTVGGRLSQHLLIREIKEASAAPGTVGVIFFFFSFSFNAFIFN